MKKQNLVKKLGLILASSAIISSSVMATACNNTYNSDSKTIAALSTDAGLSMNSIVAVFTENSDGSVNRYVSFIVHYDDTFKHQDYRITYKVLPDDYEKFAEMCGGSYKYYLNNKDLETINYIIKKYEPLNTKPINMSTYHIFADEFRFIK